jgi:hypothetical protein
MLRDNFADLVIENPKTVPTQSLAGLTISRDLPAIASDFQLDDASVPHNPEHITTIQPLVSNLRLELLPNLGKYWVFKMPYNQSISKQLLPQKALLNANYKVYMVLRQADVSSS